MRLQDGVGDVAENAGAALGDEIGGEGMEDFEQDVFHVGGRVEILGDGGEVGGQGGDFGVGRFVVALAVEGVGAGEVAAGFAGAGFVAAAGEGGGEWGVANEDWPVREAVGSDSSEVVCVSAWTESEGFILGLLVRRTAVASGEWRVASEDWPARETVHFGTPCTTWGTPPVIFVYGVEIFEGRRVRAKTEMYGAAAKCCVASGERGNTSGDIENGRRV